MKCTWCTRGVHCRHPRCPLLALQLKSRACCALLTPPPWGWCNLCHLSFFYQLSGELFFYALIALSIKGIFIVLHTTQLIDTLYERELWFSVEICVWCNPPPGVGATRGRSNRPRCLPVQRFPTISAHNSFRAWKKSEIKSLDDFLCRNGDLRWQNISNNFFVW